MAIKDFRYGMPLGNDLYSFQNNGRWTGGAGLTLDASGEKASFFGSIWFEDGGSSKTLSSSGGKIVWRTNSVTWGSSGTTVRVGLQFPATDSGVPHVPSGTWETYKEYVQGTDTLAANTVYETAMTNGSITLSHGDFVCVVFDMTVRNGSDAVNVYMTSNNYGFKSSPQARHYTTSWSANSSEINCHIICDDGTAGYFWGNCAGMHSAGTYYVSTSFRSRGVKFVPPAPMYCEGGALLLDTDGSVNCDTRLALYTDISSSTPTLVAYRDIEGAYLPNFGSQRFASFFWSPVLLQAGRTYALVLEYTGSSASCYLYRFAAFNAAAMRLMGWYQGVTRSGTSGAFSDDTSNYSYNLIPLFRKLDSGPGPSFNMGV